MRRTPATAITVLTLAACSPYDTPAAGATPDLSRPTAPTTSANAGSVAASVPPSVPCDRACWTAVIARQRAERIWWAEVVRQQQARAAWARLTAHVAAQRRATPPYRSGQCGGTLPPCYVMHRESGGNIRAQNPQSTASGKWQFLDSTWRRIPAGRGYAKARHAPEQVQDAAARWLWNGGRGCSHWSAC